MALPNNYFQTLLECYDIKYEEKFSRIFITLPPNIPRKDIKVIDIILGHIYLNTFEIIDVIFKVDFIDYYFYRYYFEEKCKFFKKKCNIKVCL